MMSLGRVYTGCSVLAEEGPEVCQMPPWLPKRHVYRSVDSWIRGPDTQNAGWWKVALRKAFLLNCVLHGKPLAC